MPSLFKPAAVFYIIVGYPVDFALYQHLRYVFYLFGRYPGKDAAGGHMGTFQHHGTGGYYAVALHHTAIHHNGTHAYEHIVVYGTAMHYGMVAYAYIVANVGGVLLVGAVYAGSILHIHLIAHFDIVHIAPHHSIEPKATGIACGNIAHQGGIGGYKTILPQPGTFAFYR